MKKPRPADSKAIRAIRATPEKKVIRGIKEIRETKAIKEIKAMQEAEKKCPMMILFKR